MEKSIKVEYIGLDGVIYTSFFDDPEGTIDHITAMLRVKGDNMRNLNISRKVVSLEPEPVEINMETMMKVRS